MARLGGMYGPDATFLGVPKADLSDPSGWAGTDVMIIGAPFDGGTSHRPGATGIPFPAISFAEEFAPLCGAVSGLPNSPVPCVG